MVTAVRIEGNQRVDTRALTPYVELQAGKPFSPEAARDDLARLFGLGDFESVDVDLVPEGDGDAVVYRVKEKSWGPSYLRFGLGFQSNLGGDNDLSLLLGLNRTRINRLGAEWRTDLQLGSERFARSGFYQPLAFRQGWFVEPSVLLRRRTVPLFAEGVRTAEIDVSEETVAGDIGYLFGRYGEARLGLAYGRLEGRRDSGQVPEDQQSFLDRKIDRGAITMSGIVDTLDDAKLPKSGSFLRLTAYDTLQSLGAEDEYAKVELRTAMYRTRGRHTGFGNLQVGTSPSGDLPVYDQFRLGGFFSLSGFDPGELAGDNYGLVRLGYYYRFSKLFHVGGYGEAARVTSDTQGLIENPVLTLTGLLVGDTPAGPLYIGAATAEQGHRTVYVLFGRLF